VKRLGIIGAENSHTAAIAKELNIAKSVRGFRVTHVWGETRAFAVAAAEAGQIPNIVRAPEDMLGQVDCVMVDHRHGKHHVPAVRPFVAARVPVFVDKPLTTSLAEAKRFLAFRRQKRAAVTTMSAVPHQEAARQVRKRLKTLGPLRVVHLNGPGDPKSKHGGVFFYGIHQADLMVELFGTGALDVAATRNGSAMTSVIRYGDGLTVTIGMPGVGGFSIAAYGTAGMLQEPIAFDKNVYRTTTGIFTRMFRTGAEPFSDERMLAPIAVLEAMDKSLRLGRRVKVGKLS